MTECCELGVVTNVTGPCFDGGGKVRRTGGSSQLSSRIFTQYFPDGTESLPSWEEPDKPEVLKKGIMVVVFSCQRFGYFVLVFL